MDGRNLSVLGLPAWDKETRLLNTIVETPKGARNKFAYDEKIGLFRLKKVLPAGMVFPFHFGFIPSTWAEDEAPLDVLVLLEEPAFPGCLVPARLLGVMEAKQRKKGKTMRNDRFIAAADKMPSFAGLKSLKDLEPKVLQQIEHFFISYNEAEGKSFKVLRRAGPRAAEELIKSAVALYQREKPDER